MGGGARAHGALGDRGVKASFFLALGPDNSGRAIFRIFRQRVFWKRCGAPGPRPFTDSRPCVTAPCCRPRHRRRRPAPGPQLAAAGHEVGLHGYDHVRWHDHLFTFPGQSGPGDRPGPGDLYVAHGNTRVVFCRARMAVHFEQPHRSGGPEFSVCQRHPGRRPLLPRVRGNGHPGPGNSHHPAHPG